MKKYPLLIFDWDGTLVDSKGLAVFAVQKIAEDLNYPMPSLESINYWFGLELMEMLQKLFPDGDLPQLVERFYYYFSEERAGNGFFEGAVEMLAYLKDSNFLLAVATNRIKVKLERALELAGIKDLFVATYTSDEYAAKPDPMMLFALLKELNMSPEDALMIGDTIFDMQFARNAGVDGLAACYGHHTQEQLAVYNPVGFIRNLGELKKLLGDSDTLEDGDN